MTFNFTGLQNKERGKGTHSSVKENRKKTEKIDEINHVDIFLTDNQRRHTLEIMRFNKVAIAFL